MIDDLYKEYSIKISHLSKRMIDNEEIAKEAAQECWFEIVKSINTFNNQSQISTWVYSIAKRTIMRYASKEYKYNQKILNEYFEDNPVNFPEESEVERLFRVKSMCDKCLTAMLHCLNNENRMIYILRELLVVPYSELSCIFDRSEQNIRKSVSRSTRKLKNYLTDQCYIYNPDGKCFCNIKRHIIKTNLRDEYEKTSKSLGEFKLYSELNKILPEKNYWRKLLK